jgi:hypothetical protein
MKFTTMKKNQTVMKRIGAIVMAASIGCASFGLLCHTGKPMVSAETERDTKPSAVIVDSLVNIASDFNEIENVVLTNSAKTATTTTSTTTTTTLITSTTTSTTTTETTTTTEIATVPTTTIIETEETTEEVVEETTTEVATTVEEEVENNEPEREYVVYKPSTHYIHRSTCRWFDSECYEISDTEGLECIKCSECNPEMDIVTEYGVQQPSQPVNTGDGYYSLNFITDTERIYLCNTVGAEYGSDWVSLYDKACVVATVMNRVYDGGWSNGLPSTVYNVLTAPYQYNPNYAVPYYRDNVTQSCIDAVEYYFEHQSEFPHYTSFCGYGGVNYFK